MNTWKKIKMIKGDFCIKAQILGFESRSNIIREFNISNESALVLRVFDVPTHPPGVGTSEILITPSQNKLIQFNPDGQPVSEDCIVNLWFSADDIESLAIFSRAFWNSDSLQGSLYSREFDISLSCALCRLPHPVSRSNIDSKVNQAKEDDFEFSAENLFKRIGF